ncbi:MAG: hypothetical protein AAFV86_21130, partial [Pseudomonadota bacterium]
MAEEVRDIAGRPWPTSPFAPIVDQAYRVFDYPTPLTTGVCDCCTDRRLMRELLTLDRRTIGVEHFRDWYDGAGDPPHETWGYFLPRILELLAQGHRLAGLNDYVLQRGPTGVPSAWSGAEWRLLDAWQRAYIDALPLQARIRLDDALTMLVLGGWPLDALTPQLLTWPDEALIDTLWREWCLPGHEPEITAWGLWDDEEEAALLAFYRSDPLAWRIVCFALAGTDSPASVARAR